MTVTEKMKEKIYAGESLTREEALLLTTAPFEELTKTADEIRRRFCGNHFDLCTIINGKAGKCSEDCKYCAQSAHYPGADNNSHPLLSTKKLVEGAKHSKDQGISRYSIVTSGRALADKEVDQVSESIRAIREETGIKVCISLGLLKERHFQKLAEAGADRVHCNLETSRSYFSSVCTTHTYQEKIDTLKAAKEAGLSLCSGGILGLGETMADRIDMILTARELGVKSIPVNILHPIAGTPYAKNPLLTNEEICRSIAVFRFLIPNGCLRLAGGRGLLKDQGKKAMESGANAAISGDMLTTQGITTARDRQLLKELGFQTEPNPDL